MHQGEAEGTGSPGAYLGDTGRNEDIQGVTRHIKSTRRVHGDAN